MDKIIFLQSAVFGQITGLLTGAFTAHLTGESANHVTFFSLSESRLRDIHPHFISTSTSLHLVEASPFWSSGSAFCHAIFSQLLADRMLTQEESGLHRQNTTTMR